MSTLKKLLDLLSPAERRRGYLVFGMILTMALLDVVGVASILPFMAVLANPEVVETNPWLAAVYRTLGFEDTGSFLFFLGVVVFFILVGSLVFKALTTWALLRFTQMRNYSLGRRLVSGYLRQPYEWFLDRHSADLGKQVLAEVQRVISGALIPAMYLIANSAVALALLALLLLIDPVLALTVTTGLGGAYVVIYLLLRRYVARIGAEQLEANRKRFRAVQETFGGIKDVKVAGIEGAMLQQFDGPAMRFAQCESTAQATQQLPRFALQIVAFGGLLGLLLYLMRGPGGLQQALPMIALYAFAGYRLMPALQEIYARLSVLRFAGPALDTLHRDLAALDPDGGASLDPRRTPPLGLARALTLEDVRYTYPRAEHPALDGLSLEIPARSTVGLVGTTGSGKTTAVDLILGLLRPQHGRLLVDGTPIAADNVRAWQRSIGYVPQHIYLSDDSVAANIAFGVPKEEIDPEAVERAARIARLHDFVTTEMPDGYDSAIGERGVRLSGGQRQRIGIARALYHDPEVLILDEATSALDNLTEQAVMEAVHGLSRRKTIILIAHRLTTVRACDRIFLLDRGRLTAQGTYDELMASNAQFREMATGHKTRE